LMAQCPWPGYLVLSPQAYGPEREARVKFD